MLVTCVHCKKPVFVSSSLAASGDVEVACNACSALLVVNAAGTVRSASGHAPAEPSVPPTSGGGIQENTATVVPVLPLPLAPLPFGVPDVAPQAPADTTLVSANTGSPEARVELPEFSPPATSDTSQDISQQPPPTPDVADAPAAQAVPPPLPSAGTGSRDSSWRAPARPASGAVDSPFRMPPPTPSVRSEPPEPAQPFQPALAAWPPASAEAGVAVAEPIGRMLAETRAAPAPVDFYAGPPAEQEQLPLRPRRAFLVPAAAVGVLLLAGGVLWAAGLVRLPGRSHSADELDAPAAEKTGPLTTKPGAVPAAASGREAQAVALPVVPSEDPTTLAASPVRGGRASAASANTDEGPSSTTRERRRSVPASVSRVAATPSPVASQPVSTPKPIADTKPQLRASTPLPPSPPPAPALAPVARSDSASPAAEHYRQGNLYLGARKVALAIEELQKCVAADPKFGLAYRSLGIAYMMLGREKSAIEAYERFVALEPAHKDAAEVRKYIASYRQRAQ